jgi:hypothetical protein
MGAPNMQVAELAAHDALTALRQAIAFGSRPEAWTENRATKHALRLCDRHVKNGTFHAGFAGEYLEAFLRTLFDY